MTLADAWKKLNAAPKIDCFADNATYTYVTSCVTLKGAREIIKQLQINAEGFKQLKSDIAHSHETTTTLVCETATSFVLEFDGKSNPLLPGIDDNMFSGKKVTVPMLYVVSFTQGEKIENVRVYWDQATVLKQIEVIGARARGWPVYDGVEQVKLIKEASTTTANTVSIAKPSSNSSRPSTATHDPYATLPNQSVPVEERGDYEQQDIRTSKKPATRDYGELFVNEESAKPDELTNRLGRGQQRQVTLSQSQYDPEAGVRHLSLNASRGHELRNSHFEFGTPDPNDTLAQKNEIPGHNKGGIRDHNFLSEEDHYQQPVLGKGRPDQAAQLDFSTESPTPAVHNAGRRGPPQASFNAFDDTNTEQEPRYNLGRRAPPQSQFDFIEPDNQPAEKQQPMSRAASSNYARKASEEFDPHGRDGYNKARRPPPQSQFDFVAAHDDKENDFDMHGRDGYNKGRRAPPQAQYDFVNDSASQPERESFGRASTRRFEETSTAPDVDIHARDGYNKGRRAPPQAQFNFMEDTGNEVQPFNGRQSQRQFTPSYGLGDENVHGRDYNMSRRGPPAQQSNFLG